MTDELKADVENIAARLTLMVALGVISEERAAELISESMDEEK